MFDEIYMKIIKTISRNIIIGYSFLIPAVYIDVVKLKCVNKRNEIYLKLFRERWVFIRGYVI